MRLAESQLALALTTATLFALPLYANPIFPGETVSPDIFPNPGSVPLLNHTSGTYSFGSGAGLIAGTYTEDVAVDPFGITCSGCLDFAYQIGLNPGLSAGIFNVTMGWYYGYSMDVGYITGTGHAGSNGTNGDPVSVYLGTRGGTPHFVFSEPDAKDPIGPGGISAVLIVATNSRTYDEQGFLAISGGRGGSPANGQISSLFEPTLQSSAPEPSTLALLGLGVAGIAGFLQKTKQTIMPRTVCKFQTCLHSEATATERPACGVYSSSVCSACERG